MAETNSTDYGAIQFGLGALITGAFGDLSNENSANLTEMQVITVVEKMVKDAKSMASKMPTDGAQDVNADEAMRKIGVVSYFLLCGRLPFRLNDTNGLPKPTFAEAPWVSNISGSARDFVETLLGIKPPTTEDAERDLKKWNYKCENPREFKLDVSVLPVMRNLQKYSTFQQWALKVMENILTKDQIKGLSADQFRLIDVNNDGKITKQELKNAFNGQALQGNKTLVPLKVDEIFKKMDNNSDEVVEFEEFESYFSLSPFLVKNEPSTKDKIKKIYSDLNTDGNTDYITTMELYETVPEEYPDRAECIATLLSVLDLDKDDMISLDEFTKKLCDALSILRNHSSVTTIATKNAL